MIPRLAQATAAVLALAVLAACNPKPVVPSLVLYGGHRSASDACRNVGVTAYTSQWLNQGGALVACPETLPDLESFAVQTGGVPVTRVGPYVVYRVGVPPVPPLRPQPL